MYVPSDGPKHRFVPPPGAMPRLHLIDYQGRLRLCEDSTGLLAGPTDRRLHLAGLHVTNLRGEKYYPDAARNADLRPGLRLRLVRDPDNPHDPFAVAVYPEQGEGPVGYVNKQKARSWSKLIADGAQLSAVSLRGTGPGTTCDAVAVLAAEPRVVDHLLSPRPASFPVPVYTPRPASPHPTPTDHRPRRHGDRPGERPRACATK